MSDQRKKEIKRQWKHQDGQFSENQGLTYTSFFETKQEDVLKELCMRHGFFLESIKIHGKEKWRIIYDHAYRDIQGPVDLMVEILRLVAPERNKHLISTCSYDSYSALRYRFVVSSKGVMVWRKFVELEGFRETVLYKKIFDEPIAA